GSHFCSRVAVHSRLPGLTLKSSGSKTARTFARGIFHSAKRAWRKRVDAETCPERGKAAFRLPDQKGSKGRKDPGPLFWSPRVEPCRSSSPGSPRFSFPV